MSCVPFIASFPDLGGVFMISNFLLSLKRKRVSEERERALVLEEEDYYCYWLMILLDLVMRK